MLNTRVLIVLTDAKILLHKIDMREGLSINAKKYRRKVLDYFLDKGKMMMILNLFDGTSTMIESLPRF